MQQFTDFIQKLTTVEFKDIVTALCIMVLFSALSSTISYWIIRILKIRSKKGKAVRKSSLYRPLRIFIIILGIYIGILLLKTPLDLQPNTMNVINKTFNILSIIIFARGISLSFTPGSSIANRMVQKTEKKKMDSSVKFLLKAIRFIIYTIAVFLVIAELGIDLSGLIAGFGVTGVIITLAAQDTAKNLFGGLMIFLDKPFIVGDWIKFDDYEGTVEDISFRSTCIRTFENSLVNIPNSVLTNNAINNWSRMEKRRFKTTLTLELGTPLEKVENVTDKIRKMLCSRDGVFDESVLVKFENIGDNGIELLIYVYTDSVNYASFLQEKEKINYKIMKILSEENVNLAYDTKTVFVKPE